MAGAFLFDETCARKPGRNGKDSINNKCATAHLTANASPIYFPGLEDDRDWAS